MKVVLQPLPKIQATKTALPKIDFTDTFATTNHEDDLETISYLIFGTFPRWIRVLFKIRNALVGWLGLKTELPQKTDMTFEVGNHAGFFEIYSIEDNSVTLGADDSHLNFRAVIYNSGKEKFNIKVSTLVEYNNRMGKVYMAIIKPFHHIVVKSMVKRAFKAPAN